MGSLKQTISTDSKYFLYLKSDAWKTRRKTWWHNFYQQGLSASCSICKSETKTLDLHHLNYEHALYWESKKKCVFLGQEKDDDLIPLCRGCHKKLHRYYNLHRFEAKNRNRKLTHLAYIKRMKKQLMEAK